MQFYEVSVEASNEQGEWQGIGYWFVKPAPAHFGSFLMGVQHAVRSGMEHNQLWHEKGLCVLITVIDVPLEQVARYQRHAYLNDQYDAPPFLQWFLTSARFGLNGEVNHGEG